tara:strand:+ start:84921 stop:85802 length:882 start_codon:yes stop_codon:yes gene_type:complete
MIRILTTTLLFILILCPSIFGQENDSLRSSLLWEIKGKKVDQPCYIMGTMHMIPKEKFLFPDHVAEKVRKSDVLVMEIGGIKDQANIIKYMMLDTGNVFNYFNEKQLDSLFEYTESELGYTEDQMRLMFGKMKPLVIMQLFTKNAFGEDPESYELTFEEIAKEDSVTIQGLETIEDQVAIFDEVPIEKQIEMLMSSLRESYSDEDNGMNDLITVFLSQDIDSIYNYSTDSGSDLASMEQQLLTNRNKNWIPLIKKLIKKNKCFIAVGAAHLGGPDGVIQLLREEGYELIPIRL